MPFSGSQRQLTFVFQFAVHTPALEFGRKHYLCGSSFRYPLVHGSTVSRLVHFKHDATTARQRHLSADEVQMCRMRCHTECTESRFQCFNADDALKFRVIRSWGGCNANHILWLNGKHSKKCTFYTLRFGCSFAAVNTIKPQLL